MTIGRGRLLRRVHAFSLAPQMDYTDASQRFLFSLLTAHAALYTEMVTANAIVHSDDPQRFFRGPEIRHMQAQGPEGRERPGQIVLQLGGSDPSTMAAATKIAMQHGFRHFNLNCGCPSGKVACGGQFGVALMHNPQLVRELCDAIADVSGEAVGVKCRIGIDGDDSYSFLSDFVHTLTDSSSSCSSGSNSNSNSVEHVIVHARKALIGKKISPADNRKIPPLRYDFAHRLAQDFPQVAVSLNGGLRSVGDCLAELRRSEDAGLQAAFVLDNINTPRNVQVVTAEHAVVPSTTPGVLVGDGAAFAGAMVGRATIDNPFAFATVDSRLYGAPDQNLSRAYVLQAYCEHACTVEQEQGQRSRRSLIKPLFGLFTGEANGKIFRSKLDGMARDSSMPVSEVIQRAAECLSADTLNMTPEQWMHREREKEK